MFINSSTMLTKAKKGLL